MKMTRSTFLKTLSLAVAGAATGVVPRIFAAEPAELAATASASGDTPLHAAARAGNAELVFQLVGKGADSNALAAGLTPLRIAAGHPDLDAAAWMVESMVVNGADPNARQGDGISPLHAAAAAGNAEAVRLLIYDGADPEARTPEGKTPFQTALAAGRKETADLLRDHRSLPRDHSTSRFAWTAAGAAYVRRDAATDLPQAVINEYVGVSHGNAARVRELLAAHPGLIVTRATWDETGVEAAAHVGNREIVELHLERGAPLSVCTAAMMGMADRVEALLREDPGRVRETGAHNIPLTWFPVVGGGQLEAMRRLLKAGVDINSAKRGQTALHVAARGGNLDMVRFLLDQGAAVNARARTPQNQTEQTPLAMALQAGRSEVAELLRSRGGV
jgi:ankyrin repeat protein